MPPVTHDPNSPSQRLQSHWQHQERPGRLCGVVCLGVSGKVFCLLAGQIFAWKAACLPGQARAGVVLYSPRLDLAAHQVIPGRDCVLDIFI